MLRHTCWRTSSGSGWLLLDDDWRRRPDMDPEGTKWFRGRHCGSGPRFVEDLVVERLDHGVAQYVILGAGLAPHVRPAQARCRRTSPGVRGPGSQPRAQAWKRQRLQELGFGIPEWLRLVPVDFEGGGCWWEQLGVAGFDPTAARRGRVDRRHLVSQRGSRAATLRQVAELAPGSTFAMTFLLPARTR